MSQPTTRASALYRFARVLAAFLAAAERRACPFVWAAFRAAAERSLADRRLALECACFDSARCDAAEWPSRSRACLTADDRRADGRRFVPDRPFAVSRAACFRVRVEARPFFGGGSFTPARRALDRPIAIACFVERAPCFPSRT